MRRNSFLAAALLGAMPSFAAVRVEDDKPKPKAEPIIEDPKQVWPETRQQRRYRERKGL